MLVLNDVVDCNRTVLNDLIARLFFSIKLEVEQKLSIRVLMSKLLIHPPSSRSII